jgi:hypothetical protein
VAQPCGLTFSPNPGPASVTIEAYWQINDSYTSSNNLALFRDTVTTGNSTVPAGTYLGWCIDISNSISNGPDSYGVLMYSSCDPNLDAELVALGLTYHFTYPATDTNATAAQWNQVNYILNHKLSGASYWDVQAAIFNIIGGPLPPNSYFHSAGYTTLTYNTNNVSEMTEAALTNAATWQPECGDVIAVILAIPANTGGYFPVQLTIIQVPFPCSPCIGVTKQVACLQPGNTCGAYGPSAEGFVGMTCSDTPDIPAFCYEITVTNCGTIPLTNVTVTDNLLGTLTANFFASPTNVFEPGAYVKAYFSMAFATNATNTVLVQGAAALAGTVTNGSEVLTNGTPVAATASATALVTPASISCALSLSSPYVSPTNNGGNVLMLPEILPGGLPVTVSVTVMNTGASPLSDVTIVPSTASGLACEPPLPFSLPAGGSTNVTLCSDSVSCPVDQHFSIMVTGAVDSDAAHCAVYDLTGSPITVCSSCMGTVECSPTGGCAVANELSGTVVLDCVVGSTNLSGDTALSGWTVSLYGASNNLLASTTTDSKGNYSFSSLGSGTYTVEVTLPAGYAETYPLGVTNGQQQVTVVACENTTGVNFGFADTTPPQISVPPGQYLGCNPTNLPSDTNIASTVTAVVSCGTPTITVTYSQTNASCSYTRTYLITVTDTYGNLATSNIVYTWTKNTTPPIISGVPTNTFLGCNGSTNLPSETTISNNVSVTAACGTATISVTYVDETNGCSGTRVFTITATDNCGNIATADVTYSWTVNAVGPTVTCPPDVTILTNFCRMYCTFSPCDWGGSCNGGPRCNNNWWQNWCGQTTSSQCGTSWSDWWNACSGNNNQYSSFQECWNNNHPTNWWCCWTNQSGNPWNQTGIWWRDQSGNHSGNWYDAWNNNNNGSQNWVPCGGNNPNTILSSCFNKVYPNGCVTVGLPGSGKCVTFTSCSAAQTCLNWAGTPGVLNGCATNPFSCSAGSFCAQVLALQLNCDFGDYGCVPGFAGRCGDLVLCDSTSPCNGKKVRDILGLCNCALGGGSCPQGCSVQYLCGLCGNLNQCFEGCQVSSWCRTHLCSVYIPSPAQTGTATVSDACSPNPTLTYCDTVSTGRCAGTYLISREWIAVDACGNTNTCTQLITIVSQCETSQICCNFNAQNPGGGFVWCNAHISCNPGQKCTIHCQNASVTLTCNDGKTYTYPVPDCQINFSPSCSSGSCSFNGTSWTTTLPCAGDDEIFLSGCGIPWQSDFANCHSVCWTGSFSCDTAGINCNWQWSAACYSCNLSNCGSIGVKPCHNTPCGYPGGDHAGTPENCKPHCQGGACGGGGGNYTGSWSGTGSCSFNCQ